MGRKRLSIVVAAGALALAAQALAAQALAARPIDSPEAALEAMHLPPRPAEWLKTLQSKGPLIATVGTRSRRMAVAAQRREGRASTERLAAIGRLSPAEASQLMELEQERSGEPAEIARPVQDLLRVPRLATEEAAEAIDARLAAALAACADHSCARAAERRAAAERESLLATHLAGAAGRWEQLYPRLLRVLARRQLIVERIVTASEDEYLLSQAGNLLAGSWQTVADLAEELGREEALASRLAR